MWMLMAKMVEISSLILLAAVLHSIPVTSVLVQSPDEELLAYLRVNHSSAARPRLDVGAPVTVHAVLSMIDLQHLDEVTGTLQISLRFQLNWTDEILQWDATDAGGIHSLVMSSDDVWMPQIHVINAVAADYGLSTEGAYVRLEETGQVWWVSTHTLQLDCPVQTLYLPFDHQRCSIKLASLLYPAAQLNITPLLTHIHLDGSTAAAANNAPWCLKASTIRDETYQVSTYIGGVVHAGIEAEVLLQRRPLLYVTYILVPCCLFSLLLLVQFGLSSESGERVTVCTQTLIGYILFLIFTSPYVTLTSSTPSTLGMYMISLLFLEILSLFIHILVSHLHTNPPESRPPSWLRRLAGACGACAEIKPQLDREPSYLSHMQMLRERVHNLSQHVMTSQGGGVMAQVPEWNVEPLHRLPPSAPSGPETTIPPPPIHDLQHLNPASLAWNIPDDRPPAPPPLDTQPRGRPPWPPGEPRMAPVNNLEILLSRQLHLLRTITDKLHEQGQTEVIIREWKAASRAISCVFVICLLFLVIILPLAIFLVVPIIVPSSLDATDGMYIHEQSCAWQF